MSSLPQMIKYLIVATLSVVVAVTAFNLKPQPSQAYQVDISPPKTLADLVETLSPAVINISTKQTVTQGGVKMFNFPEQFRGHPGLENFQQFFKQFENAQPKEREVTSLGSGFVIDPDGFIITNHHVIAKADQITVRFNDDTELEAKVVGNDPKTDLALLKVESSKPLAHVKLGDSDKARVGDWVIAIGNPFGLGGTVTTGIISARQRSINAGPYDDFIQTDAAINRGNSGGPLFNTSGEVIGINSAIFSPTGGNVGIGFSIPTALAEPIINQLKKHGKAHRGWLGVKIQDVNEEVANSIGLAKKMGALVVEINPDGPAQKAGIKAGDVITHFNGKEIKEMRLLPRMVAESTIGEKATVTVWRAGQSKKFSLTVAELKDEQQQAELSTMPESEKKAEKQTKTVAGLNLIELTNTIREELSLDQSTKGVVVAGVEKDSEAARRGLRRGDVIIEINNRSADTIALFNRLLEDAQKAGRNFALLRVVRGKQVAFVTLPIK